jgi:catechol 2,3-dioxygenase-like lactoylglutathione lyase family enzyme
MINGVHALVYAKDAEKVRAFFKDTLGFPSVDAGHGWLIFTLPPAELGIHPAEGEIHHEIYLMCDDVKATVAELRKKHVKCGPIREQGFGLVTSLTIPGGGTMGLYQPSHPTALKS